MINLDEFEQDALKELFNLGIGRAARSLSRMVHEEVILSVPHLFILEADESIQRIEDLVSTRVAAICQNFSGLFQGTAFLIYPEAQSLELVRTLLGEEIPLATLTELEQESLLEVGNIILNACLGTFANMIGAEFRFELPEFMKGSSERLLRFHQSEQSPTQVVFLFVDFITGGDTEMKHTIKGFVILLLESNALANLKKELGRLASQ